MYYSSLRPPQIPLSGPYTNHKGTGQVKTTSKSILLLPPPKTTFWNQQATHMQLEKTCHIQCTNSRPFQTPSDGTISTMIQTIRNQQHNQTDDQQTKAKSTILTNCIYTEYEDQAVGQKGGKQPIKGPPKGKCSIPKNAKSENKQNEHDHVRSLTTYKQLQTVHSTPQEPTMPDALTTEREEGKYSSAPNRPPTHTIPTTKRKRAHPSKSKWTEKQLPCDRPDTIKYSPTYHYSAHKPKQMAIHTTTLTCTAVKQPDEYQEHITSQQTRNIQDTGKTGQTGKQCNHPRKFQPSYLTLCITSNDDTLLKLNTCSITRNPLRNCKEEFKIIRPKKPYLIIHYTSKAQTKAYRKITKIAGINVSIHPHKSCTFKLIGPTKTKAN
ncbi:hypothetical protein CHS0354_015599 [Potamilus streckersoni]|uniref:Uncharacterized protein n=1 Tax=Potamilus streckersoni TaxID=2493646 RepID=A0AAE0WBL8_9BIVA|nr:hypothetical protein CHS0354_015599 [Potamilus streckersoni]